MIKMFRQCHLVQMVPAGTEYRRRTAWLPAETVKLRGCVTLDGTPGYWTIESAGEPRDEDFVLAYEDNVRLDPIDERPKKPDQLRVDRGDVIRASGEAECSVCGCLYYDHDTVRGFRWLHRACDGRLLKL